jgi:hypothetical protein
MQPLLSRQLARASSVLYGQTLTHQREERQRSSWHWPNGDSSCSVFQLNSGAHLRPAPTWGPTPTEGLSHSHDCKPPPSATSLHSSADGSPLKTASQSVSKGSTACSASSTVTPHPWTPAGRPQGHTSTSATITAVLSPVRQRLDCPLLYCSPCVLRCPCAAGAAPVSPANQTASAAASRGWLQQVPPCC